MTKGQNNSASVLVWMFYTVQQGGWKQQRSIHALNKLRKNGKKLEFRL